MSSDSIYVIFIKADSLGWIKHLLHPEISHCFVMWVDGGKWISYDTDVDKVDICTVNNMGDIIDEAHVIKIKKQKIEGGIFGLNTCVGSVKRFIGLKDNLILTPYQLYKRLNHGTI